MERERINELLAQCERELNEANQSLTDLAEGDGTIEDPESFNEEANYLLERIHTLTKEFESLLQLL